MTIRSLFATRLYEAPLGDDALIADLDRACRSLSQEDHAGRAWSKEHGYRGYTSYASLDDLPYRDPAFGDLVRQLNKHVAAFARDCAFDLRGKKLKLDSLWVNVMKPKGAHSGHIHPHSAVSGTIYIALPDRAAGLKLEDPRLPMMMAAPTRTDDAPEDLQSFVYVTPEQGTILLWESWLRHEVPAGDGKEDRISISFNYR
ncbi:hypothetical protein H5J25_05410 [Sphingomonas aliaeris]|uniref:Fe2OG dioxygenase domain-containing protein n=1 Tax=Sphingomonas aliaeris TaxID=2759526 RepID=A0A974NWC8_9SPHN|nr:TIGR02466 family protein [Sphingomonas aliaeris]QQV78156.1 hypothetical protein H5J25_05410 [Sphingomonas aliaeris]